MDFFVTARDSYWDAEPFMEFLATMQIDKRIEIHEICTASYIENLKALNVKYFSLKSL